MKRVLLLVHEYYPCGSAITNCLNPIINEMKNQDIEIDVLTRRQVAHLKKKETIDGVKIYRINDYFNIYNNKVFNSNFIFQKIYFKIILKFIWIYRTKIKKGNDGFFNYKKAVRYSRKLLNKNNYDTIISCSYPFTMHKVAHELKKDNSVVWIAYQFDPYTYNHTLKQESYIDIRLKEEINTLLKADKIFLPQENYNENINSKLNVLQKKYCILPFALINKPTIKIHSPNSSKVVFAFAGTLYEKIRAPFKMLNFFKNIDFDYEIQLYYITEKSLDKKLLEYKKYFKDKLLLYPNESKYACDQALANANILINIGNEVSNQTPSKVFELISYGKPIVNFYSIINDTSKLVLKDYPCVLNVFNKYTKDDIANFVDFCLNNKNKILPYNESTKNYMNANQVAKKFIYEVKKCHEK